MTYETITLEKKGNIATITLNRPEKLNALNLKMGEELLDVFRVVDQDDARVVIITGAGRAFCAGADIQERFLPKIEQGKKGIIDDMTADFNELFPLTLAKVRKPVIAAINGPAVGFAPSPYFVISGLPRKTLDLVWRFVAWASARKWAQLTSCLA